MSGLLSLVGWTFLPNLVTGWAQSIYYSLTIRAGDPRPQPGSPRFAEHRRRIHILVVALYLAYTIYEADYDLRRAGSFYRDLGVPIDASDREIKTRFRRLAALHHPDKASRRGGELGAINDYFVHLKTASDTLLDPVRRFAYDRFGPDTVLWTAAAGSGGSGAARLSSVYDYVSRGVGVLVPYYVGTAGALYAVGLVGYLTWGRYERWLVLACVFVFELHTVTRPHHPAVLTALLNPLLARVAPQHGAYLPFQAVRLARSISLTSFIGFSQIGPLLGADTRGGKIDMGNNDANDAAVLAAAVERLEGVTRGLDLDATRLVEMEMAPFVGQSGGSGTGADQDEAALLRSLRSKVQEWLVQNTIRADPMVRDAVGRSIQRRRVDAPAGARGTR